MSGDEGFGYETVETVSYRNMCFLYPQLKLRVN